MKLTALLSHFPEYGLPVNPAPDDAEILAVTADSRSVTPGTVFVAVGGGTTDGHRFVADALERGAAAVVGERPLSELSIQTIGSHPYIQVIDSRVALAVIAAGLNGFPARRLTMIGVTGTDGKTTTSNLIYHILRHTGIRAGMISTINAVIGDEELDTGFHVTTPDAPAVQGYLRRMLDAGMTHVVLEATSHGLAQARAAACDFDLGVVTNITHEHLDYHGSFEAYRQAKSRLFAELGNTPPKLHNPPKAAVLNRDDGSFEHLQSVSTATVLSYGVGLGDVRVVKKSYGIDPTSGGMTPGGLSLEIAGRDLQGAPFSLRVDSRLTGGFNVSNILAAVALTRGVLCLPDGAVRDGVAAMPNIPGRMEVIDLGQNFTAIIDFAHTPNALNRVLQAVRRLTRGRVIAVFGSAGLRDRQKRRMMAETSANLADFSVLTAEDPRTESLDSILAEMAAGSESRGAVEGRDFLRIADRRDAIRFAVKLARPGDLVVACGKGHEQSMCFGETEYAWDDRTAMKAALAEHLGIPGPQMPYLPTEI